jgi:hypothetical protein
MNSYVDSKALMDAFYYGVYYNPASKHYGRECSVICDKCRRSNLEVCIGYAKTDLCLSCAQSMSFLAKKPEILEFPPELIKFQPVRPPILPPIIPPDSPVTYMMSSDYDKMCTSGLCVTDMETSIFKPKTNPGPSMDLDQQFFDDMHKKN